MMRDRCGVTGGDMFRHAHPSLEGDIISPVWIADDFRLDARDNRRDRVDHWCAKIFYDILRDFQPTMAALVALGAATLAYFAAMAKLTLDREIAARQRGQGADWPLE
jgi:hypothetical protein